ncbi:MAG TPA: NFACT RNA binding domain-containing protein [Polyangiaceae bacterium]|jgi:predicted ribosome quality control (RQC) complex YloA/Tae2 family protein
MASKGRPYKTYEIDGYRVLVGRGARENDMLTFEIAEPHDLWLHVAGELPGSHVIVQNPERSAVPKDVIERAAELAAWHSKAKNARRVEVHVCHVSDVRKPRGAPAGLVEIACFDAVRVTPSALK